VAQIIEPAGDTSFSRHLDSCLSDVLSLYLDYANVSFCNQQMEALWISLVIL
jgi:hypothetical protein